MDFTLTIQVRYGQRPGCRQSLFGQFLIIYFWEKLAKRAPTKPPSLLQKTEQPPKPCATCLTFSESFHGTVLSLRPSRQVKSN